VPPFQIHLFIVPGSERQVKCAFLLVFLNMAERGGFEPPIPILSG
jgi:hypothetical protein